MSSIARLFLIAISISCVIFCVTGKPVQAGKLSRLRDKVEEKNEERKQSKSSEPKRQRSPSKREATKSSNWMPKINLSRGSKSQNKSQPDATFSRHQPVKRENFAKPANDGKLHQVSSNVRQDAPLIATRPSHPPRGHQLNTHGFRGNSYGHGHSRPGRSPYRMGLHFGSGLYPAYGPSPSSYTVIEEHYYGDPAVIPAQSNQPILVADSYVTNEPISASDYPPMPEPYVEPPVVADSYITSTIETPVEIMLKPWNVRLGIEYVGDMDDDLSQFGFDFLANATAGFGIDTDVRMLREHGVGFRDHLWLGDVNIVYELFPSEYVRPRVGVGVNWLADNYGGEAGLNLTVGADVQLLSRLTLTGEADFGTLGDSDFFHANATVGLQQSENVEWYAGYDYLDIGGVQIESLVGGLRFRF